MLYMWASGQNGSIKPSAKAKASSTTQQRLSVEDKAALQAFRERHNDAWLEKMATSQQQQQQATTFKLVKGGLKEHTMPAEILKVCAMAAATAQSHNRCLSVAVPSLQGNLLDCAAWTCVPCSSSSSPARSK